MIAARHRCLAFLLLLASLMLGCDRPDPLAPEADQGMLASLIGTGPIAPSNLTATAVSSSRVDIAWQDNSADESGFEVYGSITGLSEFTLWSTTGPGVTSQSFTGIDASREYCSKVRAFIRKGKSQTIVPSEFSNTACATTPLPPGPSNTSTRPVDSRTIEITWTDNSRFDNGFRVERSRDLGSTWTSAGTTGPDGTRALDHAGMTEQQICHRVIALTAIGGSASESAPSNVDCTTPPAGPTNLVATPAADPAIVLSWTDNSAAEDSYEVQRAPEGAGFGSVVADLPANSTSYRDLGVSSNTRYEYLVRAKKDGGFSDASNSASAVAATAPPSAPSWADAIPAASSAVDVYWRDNSTNEDGFRIERSTDGGASWSVGGTTGASEWSFTDGERPSEQPVCYRVIAFNAVGDSPPSVTDCTTPPAGPTDLTVAVVDDQTIELRWTDHSGVEDGYEVWSCNGSYCACPNDYGCELVASLPANSTSFRGSSGFTYFVAARKDGGYSDWASVP